MRFKKLISIAAAAVMTAAAMGITALADTTTTETIEAESSCLFIDTKDGNANISKGDTDISYFIRPANPAKATIFKLSDGIKTGDTVSVDINFTSISEGNTPLETCLFISNDPIELTTIVQTDVIKLIPENGKIADRATTTIGKSTTSVNVSGNSVKEGNLYLYLGCGNITEDGKTGNVKIQISINNFTVTRTTADTPVSGDVSPTSKAVYGNEEGDTDGICSVGAVFNSVSVEVGKNYVWKLSNGTETAEIAVDETVFGSIQGNAKFGVIIYNVPSELADKVNVVFAPKSE